MVRVWIGYERAEGANFDHVYYRDVHCPMFAEVMKPYGLLELSIDRGLTGAEADSSPKYLAMASITYETAEGFFRGMEEKGSEVLPDIKNYTNTTPIIQVSEAFE